MKLMRELRCYPEAAEEVNSRLNSWAGSPANDGLGVFWSLRAIVEGPIDERTGYLCTIEELDRLLRRSMRLCFRAWAGDIRRSAVILGRELVRQFPELAGDAPARLNTLELKPSPFLGFAVLLGEPMMIRVTQSFEFSASHRLFCADLTREENQRLFGKCANPNGHGHNYVLEVTVRGPAGEAAGSPLDLLHLQRVVKERVIDRLDHKHLNLDCAEFSALNPTVENIARVIWELLAHVLPGGALASVRVWETPKTYAEYDGG